jgi:hypothetical protein
MVPYRASCLLLVVAFALTSTGCGFSIWPWGNRANSATAEPRRETKPEKCARLVREACDAAVAIRRADMLEIEGAAIVGARGGGPDQSARMASRAADAARSASAVYVSSLDELSKLPGGLVDTQISNFVYQDKKKQELLSKLKPVIRRNLKETKLGLKPSPEACIQDLQSSRYLH